MENFYDFSQLNARENHKALIEFSGVMNTETKHIFWNYVFHAFYFSNFVTFIEFFFYFSEKREKNKVVLHIWHHNFFALILCYAHCFISFESKSCKHFLATGFQVNLFFFFFCVQ